MLPHDAGNQEVARKCLDWLREGSKINSENNPLGGAVFPHLWNRGAAASPTQVRYAAASLMQSKEALPILQEAINLTSGDGMLHSSQTPSE